MIKTVKEHSFRDDLLVEGGYILDLGCNGFGFPTHMVNRGMKVIGLDPKKGISIPAKLTKSGNFTYIQKACVGVKESDVATYYEYANWGANSIVNSPDMLHRKSNGGHAKNPSKTSYEVPLTTIAELMEEFNISQFEYIKIDIEGAEYDILENLPTGCVKQFSVEFHDFLGLNPTDDIEEYHRNLLAETLSDFRVEYEDKKPLKDAERKEINGVFQRNDVLYVLKSI